MEWDIEAAVNYLDQHGSSKVSRGLCAKYTADAIQAGGITLLRHRYAKDFGPSLLMAGFQMDYSIVITKQAASSNPSQFQPLVRKGDVVVIQGFPGHPAGHMAMYDGKHWVSDFTQRSLYPGPAYRRAKPSFVIYRHAH